MAEEKLVTVRVLQNGVEIGGAKREKGDLVTIPQIEADVLARNNLVKVTKKKSVGEESEEASDTEDISQKLDEAREKSGSLPPRYNARMAADNKSVKEEPPVDPLKGKIVQTGDAKYGPFVVIEELGTGEEFTVFQSTALKAFINTADRMFRADGTIYGSVEFLGVVKKEGGQSYLDYDASIVDKDGKMVRLQEPEKGEEE